MHNGFSFSGLFSGLWQSLTSMGAHDTSQAMGRDAALDLPTLFSGVNVDGTPMLNDAIDVMGKAYGDSGSSFSHDHGVSMLDSGAHSSSSDW